MLQYPIESRVLSLERKMARAERAVEGQRIDLAGIQQGIWDAWSGVKHHGVMAPPPGCGGVTAFPMLSPCIPFVLPFMVDYLSGTFGTLTWNGSSPSDATGSWTGGCLSFARPASFGCTARTIPTFFSLLPNPADPTDSGWTFRTGWIDTSGTCPDTGKTCADVASVNQTNDYVGALSTNTSGDYVSSGSIVYPNDLMGGFAGFTSNFYINNNFLTCLDNHPPTWLPATLNFTDSMWGSGTLTWVNNSWTGCLSGLAYPGYGSCAAKTIAIHYTLDTSGVLTLRWTGIGGGNCPGASTCASITSFNYIMSQTSLGCAPFVAVYGYAGGSGDGLPAQNLYQNTPSTITIMP